MQVLIIVILLIAIAILSRKLYVAERGWDKEFKKMKLLTKEIEKALPALYATENVPVEQKKLVVKFFTPWTNWTWYGAEYNPEDRLFFGLVVGSESEWGYFSLDELQSVKGPFGLNVERDLGFSPRTMRELS